MLKIETKSTSKIKDPATRYASDIWENLGLTLPVDLPLVAKRLGIDIYERLFTEEIDGFYMSLPDTATVIVINSSPHKSIARRRFTLAHELAHHFLTLKPSPNEKIFCFDTHKIKTTILEKACDRFAVTLLMPSELIIQNFNELAKNEENRLEIMAERFGVSICAMQRRVTELRLMKRTFRRIGRY